MELFPSLLLHTSRRLVNVTDPEKRGLWSKNEAKKQTGLGWNPFSIFPKVRSPASKSQATIYGICGEDWLEVV